MEKFKINKISVDVVWEMIWRGWEISRVNYPLTIGIVFIFFFGMMFGAIPFVGPIITAALATAFPLVFLTACSHWEKNNGSNLNEIMAVFKRNDLIQAMTPLLAINFALGAVPGVAAQIPFLATITTMFSFAIFPLSILLNLAVPIFFFNYKSMTVQKSITLAVEGLGKNIVPFIVGGILLMAITVFSAIALVLPLLLVGIPILMTYQYLWYRVVYEDLVLEVKDEGVI